MPEREMNRGMTDSLIRTIGSRTWKVFLLLVWAAWWGGLGFYAVVVVPIGTDIIGSVEQGFVTQRVTQWHNGLSVLFLVCLVIEASRGRNRWLWAMTVVLGIITITLLIWHVKLTEMMDLQQRAVSVAFYAHHAIYLWLTAAEWLVGMAMPSWIIVSAIPVASAGSDHPDRSRT